MNKAYEPRGYARAAIEHLRALPAGSSLGSAELADVVGCAVDCLQGNMATAVKYGLLRREPDPADRRRIRWRLGDGTPAPAPAAPDDDDDRDDAPPSAPSHAEVVRRARAYPPHPFASPVHAARVPAAAPRARCALWSDGSLHIEAAAGTLQLQPDEALAVVRYLVRLERAALAAAVDEEAA